MRAFLRLLSDARTVGILRMTTWPPAQSLRSESRADLLSVGYRVARVTADGAGRVVVCLKSMGQTVTW